MHLQHRDFDRSRALRAALKRGLARQALVAAGRDEADLPAIFARLCNLSPNRKALERAVSRLAGQAGVVRATLAADRQALALTLRNLRVMVQQVDGQEVFRETALVFTRVLTTCGRTRGLHLSRASFCGHALERLVERSDLPLDLPLLPAVDAEAASLLHGFWRGRAFTDHGDAFIRARQTGVWAGGEDEMPLEEDWGLALSDRTARIPAFSVRTFLGPDEMRPTIWAKWKGDPTLQVME